MRIAHFGRYAQGATDIVRSMFLSLKKSGHVVQEWNLGAHPEWVYNPHRCLGGNGPVYIRLSRIRSRLMRFRPHLIICNAGGYTFSKKDFLWLKKRGIPVLGITLSDPDVFPTVSRYSRHFTWHATNSLLAYRRYKQLGHRNVHYFPFGIDERFFRQRPVHSRFKCDVAVIAHGRRDRYPLAWKLVKNFDTKLYGNSWPFPKNSPGPVRGEDWFRAAYSAKMLVNFPRTVKGYTNVKVGIFEAAATGRLVFTQYFPEMRRFFRYSKEIVGYSSSEDLIKKIRYYLNHLQEAKKIARAGRERCWREHTWTRRFHKLFREIGIYHRLSRRR
ncbi:glycosyltransferase [Polycladomyces sp. WAk]|uniref:Glycosyltransferase n=1 Tax=Polycladomyces zharkentensis TaxID=2807616 RepID=A0ABS2WM93_9BACL|nr:glycosyltransferase [Polycladomyces sp. WAk]MBN2910648.1 glycosyltransferase [Polycladomyces sp. WAk]